MGTFLDEINNALNNKTINEWYIDEVFFEATFWKKDDSVSLVIKKYLKILSLSSKEIVEEKDAKVLLDEYKNEYNVLIKATLDYLISCSKFRNKSNLPDDCKEIIRLFFDNINIVKGGLSLHSMVTILRWTVYKYPTHKNVISNNIYDRIVKGDNALMSLSVIEYILKDNILSSIFDFDNYKLFFLKFYKMNVEKEDFYFYMDLYNDFMNYFKLKNRDFYRETIKMYCDFIIKNIDLIDDYAKQIELQKVRKYMDNFKAYGDKDYHIIDIELERVNKIQLSKLKKIVIPFSDEQRRAIEKQSRLYDYAFSSLDNPSKIRRLMREISPILINEIQKNLDEDKNSLTSMFKANYLDSKGRVINFEELNQKEEFSLKGAQYINFSVEAYIRLIFSSFYNFFNMDADAEEYIHSVLSENKMVDGARVTLLTCLFVAFFKGDFEHSIFDIVLELEESLRYYLKNNGLNIIKRDGSGDKIGLNNIFNNFDTNSFRDELYKVIDEDYYFTLKWFLTDEYGFDLRDKVSHRIDSVGLYETNSAIYITILIFRLYWWFQKD